MNRVFGFEITPAPFVIAHWQIGMLLAAAGAPLAESERAAVYLTNSLTGWLPPQGPRQRLLMPELEPERDAAERVKRVAPILVVIGNPPYNAYTGVSPEEEEGLVEPYKQGLRSEWGIKKYNLDELYVRFLRVAERRIVEGSGRGIISYVSSYSYLSDPSFVVVRRHLLDGFDSIWIDCLNGDSRETGKRTPSGDPDPSVFSTASNPGIKLGTAVGMFVRQGSERHEPVVRYREFWGVRKREELLESLNTPAMEASYESASPRRSTRYNFRPQGADNDYTAWPDLIALAEAEPFSGLAEMRRGALLDFNRADLETRMQRYLDPNLSFETVRTANVGPVGEAGRFDAEVARKKILAREPFDPARIVRYAILPLDTRFAYHTNVRPIWNEPRPEFAAQAIEGNVFVVSRMMAERPQEGLPVLPTKILPDYHLLRPNIRAFPTRIHEIEREQVDFLAPQRGSRANLSARARQWLESIGAPDPDADTATGSAPWFHALAICCSPAWLDENHAAILGGWPRFPLPTDLAALRASAALGARIAALLDTDEPIAGVTAGQITAPYAIFGRLARKGGGSLSASELAVTAGWGRGGLGQPVMPGPGRITEREAYASAELAQIDQAAATLGEPSDALIERLGLPVDVWLNDVAYWQAVPMSVWSFTIGGYQVLKKWLSYRDQEVMGRPLTASEAREASAIIKRLTALVLMQPQLDANYQALRSSAFPWAMQAPAASTADTV